MAFCRWLWNDGTHILLNDGVSVLLMNDNSCSDFVPPTQEGGSGAFPGAWRKRRRKHIPDNKRELIDELDELLMAVRAQIVTETASDELQRELRRAFAIGIRLDENDTFERLENEIALIKELLAEADDEDAFLLLH